MSGPVSKKKHRAGSKPKRAKARGKSNRGGSILGWVGAGIGKLAKRVLGLIPWHRLWPYAVAGVALGCVFLWWNYLRPGHQFDKQILEASRRYGVDAALIKAVIWKESRFKPRAVGAAGEVGLMQVTDPAAQEWAAAAGVYPVPRAHLFDPQTNILAGSWYLKRSLNRHPKADDSIPFGLAEYNAGRGNLLKWAKGKASTNSAALIEAIGFPSTKRYVNNVIAKRLDYLPDFPRSLADSPR